MRLRYGENFAGATQAIALRRDASSSAASRSSFHPAGHVLGSAQIAVEANGMRIVASGDYKDVPDPTCAPFELCRATSSSPRRRSACRCSAMATPTRRDRQAAALGRAVSRTRASGRRLFARQGAARDRADPRGRLRQADLSAWRDGEHHALLRRARHRSRRTALVRDAKKAELAGTIAICPPSALQDRWTRRFPDPVTAFASGWMRVRARARQRGVELPLVISDHADWDGLHATIAATGASRDLGDAWRRRRRWCTGARMQRPEGAAAAYRRLWR